MSKPRGIGRIPTRNPRAMGTTPTTGRDLPEEVLQKPKESTQIHTEERLVNQSQETLRRPEARASPPLFALTNNRTEMAIAWKTMESGLFYGVPHHDGLLTGLRVRSSLIPTLDLYVDDSEGIHYQYCLENIGVLKMTDFLESNIINSIFVWPLHTCPQWFAESLLGSHGRTDEPPNPASADQLLSGQKFALALDCSYGARLYLTFDTLTIERLSH